MANLSFPLSLYHQTLLTPFRKQSAGNVTGNSTPGTSRSRAVSGTLVVGVPTVRLYNYLRFLGQLTPNWHCGFWDDTDLDVNTPYMRGIYPEGFEWTCCGRDGESKGCVAGYHKAVVEAWVANHEKLDLEL
ncbi:hypothetical protein BKA81DRAFT_150291 [Phyllosticta paracitricarpa]